MARRNRKAEIRLYHRIMVHRHTFDKQPPREPVHEFLDVWTQAEVIQMSGKNFSKAMRWVWKYLDAMKQRGICRKVHPDG